MPRGGWADAHWPDWNRDLESKLGRGSIVKAQPRHPFPLRVPRNTLVLPAVCGQPVCRRVEGATVRVGTPRVLAPRLLANLSQSASVFPSVPWATECPGQ